MSSRDRIWMESSDLFYREEHAWRMNAKASALAFICSIAIAGCASSPTRTPHVQQLPMRVALILPDNAVRQGWRSAPMVREVTGKGKAIADSSLTSVAKSSATLFVEWAKGTFESVEILPDVGNVSEYQLVLTPAITGLEISIDQSKATLFEAITVKVEYSLEVSRPDHGTVLSTLAEGIGHPQNKASQALVGLLAGVADALLSGVTISGSGSSYTPRPNLLVASYATSALEEAQSNAIGTLINAIQSSEQIQAIAKLEVEKRSFPSELLTSVKFDDSQSVLQNNRLDAGEEAALVVTLTNQGRGSGFGVVLAVSADPPLVVLPESRELGELPPGAVTEIRLPVKAGLQLPEGEVNLLIDAHEKRGYGAKRVKLVLSTARLNRPSFSITKPEVNGILANGEKIELVVPVKNTGSGPAAGTTLSITAADPGIELVRSKTILGERGGIEPNEVVRGSVEFAIPRTFSGSVLNLALQVSDGRGDAVASAILPVKLNVEQRKTGLTAKMRLLRSDQEVEELENGQTVDVEITPKNNGDLDAVQVSIRVRADHPGVRIQPDQTEVGYLKRKAIGSPRRFELTIPRGFTDERLPLFLELSQKDFAGSMETRFLPIKVHKPELVPGLTVRGRLGGSAIEQNETADLEVHIHNKGDLLATSLEAKIDVSMVPGMELQSPNAVAVSKLEPKGRAVVPFKLRVHKSVAPGVHSISLVILQTDFPPIRETLHVQILPEKEETVRVEKTSPPTVPFPSRQRPVIELKSPSDGDQLHQEHVVLRATLIDAKGVDYVQVELNGQMLPQETVGAGRTIRPQFQEPDLEVSDLVLALKLKPGTNTITVRAYNLSKQDREISLKVTRLEEQALPRLATSTPMHYLNSWALVIGINAYKKYRPLRFAISDALAVEDALRKLGFPSKNIRLLLDGDATKDQIEGVLYKEFPEKGMGPHDRLFVFFSGHGLMGKKKGGEEGFLMPVDGNPSNLPLTAIAMDDIRRIGERVPALHVLFVLDACFSGFALAEDVEPHVATEEPAATEKPVVQVLTAGRTGEEAIEKGGLGLFTRRFLDVLRDLGDRGGVLTATELGVLIKRRVSQDAKDAGGKMTPQYGRLYGEGQFQFSWPKR